MSKKRQKKRNRKSSYAAQNPNQLQQTSQTKKMNPLARNLLLLDLVIMGASLMMQENGLITETVGNAIGIMGMVMMVVAIYLEFGPNSDRRNKL